MSNENSQNKKFDLKELPGKVMPEFVYRDHRQQNEYCQQHRTDRFHYIRKCEKIERHTSPLF